MTVTAVSRCTACEAVVNIHWPACLVCQTILPPGSKILPHSEATPDDWGRIEPLHLEPGLTIDLLDGDAIGLQEKKVDPVRSVLQAGDWLEWLSPALPKQQGEVLAVHRDGTFEVYHPLAKCVRRLPVSWITKVCHEPPEAQS